MRRTLVGLVIGLMFSGQPMAGTVAGFGGSTEITQILNNFQLIMQYEQQVQGYIRQGLQFEAELRNLMQNPTSVVGPEIGALINNIGRAMDGAKSIGSGLARIDANFATTFKSPTAARLSQSFTRWHATSTDTLEAAMRSAGMYRDQQQTTASDLRALVVRKNAAGGALQAIQTVADINIESIKQFQKLGDLMATQNLAVNTYLTASNAKAEATNSQMSAVQDAAVAAILKPVPLDTTERAYPKWNLYPVR